MVVLTGLSYIFIGLACLYQIWHTFIGLSIGLEVFRMKHDWLAIVVDIVIALLCTLLFVVSVFSIYKGLFILLGGTL